MKTEVIFSPAGFSTLPGQDLSATVCVVFDVLRATSTITTALANGANAIIPVATIPEAVDLRTRQPQILLAGERMGIRISAELTGGVEFDLGNSPREFTPETVGGRTIAITTTNGTVALRACAKARTTFAASFLNLEATAAAVLKLAPERLLIVCSGTLQDAAYEDTLGAGALVHLLPDAMLADSALIARNLYRLEQSDITSALGSSRNGRRLRANPTLVGDLAWCAQVNLFPVTAILGIDGRITKGPGSV